jgi:uncharacterized membrane protein
MKFDDIQKIHEARLITEEQRGRIIEHFHLKEDGNKFLAIISIVGAVLVAAGITLLIASHWNEIPRGVKITAGILIMLGAHTGGWLLCEGQHKYHKTGEALHLIGSCLFLANIALIGQIYNLVTRPPNAILLWWVGIAALPCLLRSKAQHVLLLLAFGLWFGLEVNERDSFLFSGNDQRQLLLYAMLGLVYLGTGYCLRRTKFPGFAGVTEKLGLLTFLIFSYPLTWKNLFDGWENTGKQLWIFPALGTLALLLLSLGLKNLNLPSRQWRWTWFAALFGMAVFLATDWFGLWQIGQTNGGRYGYWEESWSYFVATFAFFVFCLLQIQIGIQQRSAFLVNVGVTFLALDIITTYFNLIGSMARTGTMFVMSGVFLIVFGIYLEKKRRKLMKQIKSPMAKEVQ